jgi:glutaredoxin
MTAPRTVALYTRHGCGLCDDASFELRALSGELGFVFEERDIDNEPALREHYNDVIPVVIVDGNEVARAPFDSEELRELVRMALRLAL